MENENYHSIFYGKEEPKNQIEGDMWYKSSEGTHDNYTALLEYYDNKWDLEENVRRTKIRKALKLSNKALLNAQDAIYRARKALKDTGYLE